jgi:hypothetical protein
MSLLYLYDLDLPALEALLADWGEPRYRARKFGNGSTGGSSQTSLR